MKKLKNFLVIISILFFNIDTNSLYGKYISQYKELIYPAGMVNMNDNILIAEAKNNKIVIIDNNNNNYSYITGEKINGFYGPQGISVYNNKLYVLDSCKHRVIIYKINKDGDFQYKSSYGKESYSINMPFKSFFYDKNKDCFLVDTMKNEVVKLRIKSQEEIEEIYRVGNKGTGNYQFNMPLGIFINKEGIIYINDSGNNRVQVYRDNENGLEYIKSLKKEGAKPKEFYYPKDIEIGKGGEQIIADTGNSRIQIIRKNSVLLITEDLKEPYGIGIDKMYNIYVADRSKNKILKFTEGGKLEWEFNGIDKDKLLEPSDVCIDYENKIFVCDRANSRIVIYNDLRKLVKKIELYGKNNEKFNTPEKCIIDNRGYLYISDSNGGKIVVFDEGVYLVDLKTSSLFFSPNNDGILDDVALSFVSYEPMEGVLSVYNSKGKEVQTLWKYENNTVKTQTGYIAEIRDGKFKIKNSKVITNKFIWNGKDKNNNIAGDGLYVVSFDIKDYEGSFGKNKSAYVEIDTTPPVVTNISVSNRYFSPDKDGSRDFCKIDFFTGEKSYFMVDIENKEGKIIGGLNEVYTNIPDGKYNIRIKFIDEAGNSRVKCISNIVIDLKKPKIVLDVSNTIFSPNNDGIKDFAEIKYSADEKTDLKQVKVNEKVVPFEEERIIINSNSSVMGTNKIELLFEDKAGNKKNTLTEKIKNIYNIAIDLQRLSVKGI